MIFTELAASEPKSEIVGKSEYFRFGMRDSLAIEASFLQVVPFLFLGLVKNIYLDTFNIRN